MAIAAVSQAEPSARSAGRVVVRWPVMLSWATGFTVLRLLLGGYIGPATGVDSGMIGHLTRIANSLSFVWVPSHHLYVTVWWPAWLGALALGLLLGAALGTRRTDCCVADNRWAAGGGGLVAALAGLGCCGIALPATLFADLVALGQYVRLADAVMVALCVWALYRTLSYPQGAQVEGRGKARTLTLFGRKLITVHTR